MAHPDKERRRKGKSLVALWASAGPVRARNGLVLDGEKPHWLTKPGRFTLIEVKTKVGQRWVVARVGSVIKGGVPCKK